jgi:NAD(P)-dependent dehydrogenase (short-subunit alcohol dehydrogenase family)
MSTTWSDKTILITGGSSGIGRATALAFADAGAHVLVTGRRPEALAALVAERPTIATVVADAAEPADASRTIAAAVDRWGGVDVLINNAGAGAVMPLAQANADKIKEIFAVNVLGPSMLAAVAAPYLAVVEGSIVNVSSTLGQKAAAGISHYAAAKAALDHLTRCWALELAPQRIRVNAVAAGPTRSNALTGMFGLSPEQADAIEADERTKIPLGRRGEPVDISRWIMAFADPDASWVTGQVLTVDGGLLIS